MIQLAMILLIGMTMSAATTDQNKSYKVTKGTSDLFRLKLKGVGPTLIDQLKSSPKISFWIETTDELYLMAPKATGKALQSNFDIGKYGKNLDNKFLYISIGATRKSLKDMGLNIVAYSGRSAVVSTSNPTLPPSSTHIRFKHFEPNIALSRRLLNIATTPRALPQKTTMVDQLISHLNATNWRSSVEHLSQINRYSHNKLGTEQTVKWIEKSLSRSNENVTSQAFTRGNVSSWNVISRWRNTPESNKPQYIVGAHFDSHSERPHIVAPGAEDNASGIAALIELARVISKTNLKLNIDFIAFGGEEQGLHGSKQYVRELMDKGDHKNVQAALIMDMIAYSSDNEFDILIETAAPYQSIIDNLYNAALARTNIDLSQTFHYWGSDHVPFIDNKIPAVLVIENDYGEYPDYHRTTDTPKKLNNNQALEVLKMLAATIGQWAIDSTMSGGTETQN